MDPFLKVLMVDSSTGFYKTQRYPVGEYFGPVDLGLLLSGKNNSLNFGTGLLAGSIFPGSNRLIFSGFSPCWGGFYVSSMGGAGLVFDNLGLNLVSIVGKAATPSVLILNRSHGEEIKVELQPIDPIKIWNSGRGGVYSMMEYVYENHHHRYETDPRVLAVGPAAMMSDVGAIASAPIKDGKVSFVDTWAGRGGLGSKMFQDHNIVAVIYGGTFIDQDFRDRKVADSWFETKYNKKLAAKALESTAKYRFEEKFETGGTFGVNYATVGTNIIAFNYKTIYWTESERKDLHQKFIVDHYLKQFNEETIKTKQFKTCGEACSAVCKKMRGHFKKDYEPYQTMGPLSGIFDQRAAEMVNHKADMYGFDGISIGGVIAWLMECVADGLIKPAELGLSQVPVFSPDNFHVVRDSMQNAQIAVKILDGIISGTNSMLDLSEGARVLAKKISMDRGRKILDKFIYVGYGRKGWMVPNQYWTPGVLSPMPIMGKYYMNYGKDFFEPKKLGVENATRMIKEIMLDNLGICRFHRQWAEEMIPDIMGKLYGKKYEFQDIAKSTSQWINTRNSSQFWESERNFDLIKSFIDKKIQDGGTAPELLKWSARFNDNKRSAAYDFWYDIHKGVHETLKDF
jgi:glyceraldehyde-3-phosphate dehydrogenase (ferredoxin)